jgi:hypothetical protein
LKGTFALVSGFGTKSQQVFKVPGWAFLISFGWAFLFDLGFGLGFFWRDFPFLQEVAKSKLDSCFVGKRRKTSVLDPLPQGPEGNACSLSV